MHDELVSELVGLDVDDEVGVFPEFIAVTIINRGQDWDWHKFDVRLS